MLKNKIKLTRTKHETSYKNEDVIFLYKFKKTKLKENDKLFKKNKKNKEPLLKKDKNNKMRKTTKNKIFKKNKLIRKRPISSLIKSFSVFLLVSTVILGQLFSPQMVMAASYTFSQNSWIGGKTSDISTSQTGWNQYLDSYGVYGDNDLTLLNDIFSVTKRSSTDFSAGTKSQVDIYGNGDSSYIGLGISSLTQPQIVASTLSAYALKSDGTVWSWGDNTHGQLGINSTTQKNTPAQIYSPDGLGYLKDIISITSNENSAYALKSDGTVWAWGRNNNGQLGDGSTTQRNTPVQVRGVGGSGYLTDVISISSGMNTAYALKSDGTVWSWGVNNSGQLGDNTTDTRLTPVQVKGEGGSGYLINVVKIGSIESSAYAVKNDGTVWSWGLNTNGQLGDGSTTQRNTPVQVRGVGGSGYLSNIISFSGGSSSVRALKSDGTLFSWGINGSGQLGDGSTTEKNTPVQVLGTGGLGYLTDVISIASQKNTSYALKSDGTVWAWGSNANGQVGDNTTETRLTPVQVKGVAGSGFLTGIVNIGSGDSFAYAIKNDGTIFAWGQNTSGQLGDNTTSQRNAPVQVILAGLMDLTVGEGNFTPQIRGGSANAYLLKKDGTVWAWGYGGGRIGDGFTSSRSSAVQVVGSGGVGVLENIIQIAGGESSAYALSSNGEVWAWGDNSNGKLGDNTISQRNTPVKVLNESGSGNLTGIKYISGGSQSAYAVKSSDGSVLSWGLNNEGQLGNNSLTTSYLPVRSGSLVDIEKVHSGYYSAYAVNSSGNVWSWGYNSGAGALGNNSSIRSAVPVAVLDSSGSGQLGGVTDVVGSYRSSGTSSAFAVKNGDGSVWAWGANGFNQLGNNLTSDSRIPIATRGFNNEGTLTGMTKISSSGAVGRAIKSDGTVWSWGRNSAGEIGDGTKTQRATPVQVSNLSNIIDIGSGDSSGYAIHSDGVVYGWGSNENGRLGDGTTTERLTPVRTQYTVPANTVFNLGTTGYYSSGVYTSSVVDLGSRASLSEVVLNTTLNNQTITVDIRAGNTPSPDGTWTGWLTNVSGAWQGDISSLGSKQYVQYRVNLSTSSEIVTPRFNSIEIIFQRYELEGYLVSSVYDTTDSTNLIKDLKWNVSGTSETETLKFQIRTSADNVVWSEWCGFTECTGSDYFESSHNEVLLSTNHPLRTGGNDRYIQYKVYLTSAGVSTPVITNITVGYENYSAPSSENLSQFKSNGSTAITAGSRVNGGSVVLKVLNTFGVATSSNVKAQFEVRPTGTSFTNTVTSEGDFVSIGSVSSASITLSDDSYHWQARLIDSNGNFSPWTSYNSGNTAFILDNVKPSVNITYSKNPVGVGINTITATYTEPISGTPSISINQQGSTDINNQAMTLVSPGVYTYDYNVSKANGGTYKDGEATVSLSTVTDIAGNSSNSPTGTTFVIDTTGPSVALSYSKNRANAGLNTITATYSKPVTSAPNISINQPGSVDISGVAMTGSGTVWTYGYTVNTANGSSYIDGETFVSLSSVSDVLGNIAEDPTNTSFIIDTQSPTAEITYSPNRPIKSGDVVTITATFNEEMLDSPLPKIAISGANTLSSSNMTKIDTTHYSYSHTVGSGNGLATVTLGTGLDLAGNVIVSTPVSGNTFSIDNTPPAGFITAFCEVAGNGCTTIGENASPQEVYMVQSITGTASDTGGSGVSDIKFSIKDTNTNKWYNGISFVGLTEQYLQGEGTTSWSVNTSSVPLVIDSIYEVNIKISDVALNNSVISKSFKFTNAPPTVSNVNAVQSSDGTVTVTYDVNDIESTQTTNYLFYGIGATLLGNISNSSSSLTVSSGNHLPQSGVIMIEDEIISFSSRTGGSLSGLTRGSMSTTALAHLSGSPIYVYATSATGEGIGLSNKGTGKEILWLARNDADGYENLESVIRVVANDGASGSMIGASNSGFFVLDAKKPTATITFDAGVAGFPDSATITIPMPIDMSSVEYNISDDPATQSNPATTGWTAITENTTIPWFFDTDIESKHLKYQFRDSYGNVSEERTASTHTPVPTSSFMVQDTSNVSIIPPYYDLYIGWQAITGEGFSTYKLEQSTSSDNINYSPYSDIVSPSLSDISTNYFVYRNLNPDLYYKFRLGILNTEGNISVRSNSSITTKPDGVQNFGEGGGGSVLTAPKIENVVVSQSGDKNINITYRLTDPSTLKKVNPSYEAYVFYNTGITLPEGSLSGNNLTISDASKLKTSGYIQVNNEVIRYTGKTGNTLTGITRGTWPTSISQGRASRINNILFAGTPVWVLASGTSPVTIQNNSILAGQNGSISWNTYTENSLAGYSYPNVGVRVLVHDNQDVLSGPLSSQNDYSEIGTINILDLTAPSISFTETASEGSEETTPVIITINLSRAYPLDTTVNYSLSGTAGMSDYNLSDGVATIVAGQTTTTIEIPIINDSLNESNETIIITLSNPTNGTLGLNTIYTYTIIDDDSFPIIGFESTSSFGDEGISLVNIPVSISSLSGAETSVSYIVSGTATGEGVDYTLANGTIIIPAGETFSNIALLIEEDLISELDETIIITLSSPINAILGENNIYTYTIIDNDNTPLFGFTEESSSGLESITSVNIPISIPVASMKNITVSYNVTGGTATPNTDFILDSGTATILAGSTTVNIPLTIINDSLKESNETIVITLSNPINATLGSNINHTYTIIDDEADINISFASSSSTGLESTEEASFTVNLSSVSSQDVITSYTISGTATGGGVDYTLSNGTITIPAGQTSANITALIIDDTINEPNETIIITLSNPINATLGIRTVHTYTILDNDNIPVVGFTATMASGLESVTSVNIPLLMSPSSYQDVNVTYNVTGGTATPNTDFILDSGTATILAGSTTVNIPLTIINDSLKESNETIIITLSNPTNGTLGLNTIYTYTIIDDDISSGIEFGNTNGTGLESIASVVVPVTLATVSGIDTSVDYEVSGTATGGGVDYTLSNGTITIPAGQTSANINLSIINDILKEENETIIITLSNAIGATLGVNNIYTYIIIDDDEYPTLEFVSSTSEGSESVGTANIPVSISSAYAEDVTFSYSVTGGTANGGGEDYLLVDGTGTILAGETTTNIKIIIYDDSVSEETETIVITISDPVNSTLGLKRIHAYSILDNEIKITEINSEIKATSALVTWTTADYTDSLVQYGTVAPGSEGGGEYSLSKFDAKKVLNHSIYLGNLTPSTVYYIKTTSVNLAGEATVSESTLTTTAGPIISGVSSGEVTDTGVVITWVTDIPATSYVSYKTGDQLFSFPGAGSLDLTTTHSVSIVGLNSQSTYDYLVYGADDIGNISENANDGNYYKFTTGEDQTAPIISSPSVPIITSTEAAIVWTTNEPADGMVRYGTSSGDYTKQTEIIRTPVLNHLVTISGLEKNTTYYYQIESADPSGNTATYQELTFKTTEPEKVIIYQGGGMLGVAQELYDILLAENVKYKSKLSGLDSNLPVISNIAVDAITAFGATISFETSEDTVAFIDYGKNSSYGFMAANKTWSKVHSIKITGLSLGTEYFFKINAMDKSNDVGFSEEEKFTTKFLSEDLSELKKIENVEQFQAEIEATIESILPSLVPPFIDKPTVSDITENSATITFRTNIKAYPTVSYITDNAYDKNKENPYEAEISDTSEKRVLHTISLIGLKPNTKYHFMAKAFSLPKVVGRSDDLVFTTKASKIRGSVIDIKKDSFTVVWSTDEPTSSIIEYKNLSTGRISRLVDDARKNSHFVKIENLTPGTSYEIGISGINNSNNLVEGGEIIKIKTSTDNTPPVISNLKVESALIVGRTDRVQTIVSWQTDEPSTSTVYYEEGSGSSTGTLANKQEDLELTKNHVVILTTLKPGTVYRFTVDSTDAANNMTKPPIRTIITPKKTESIVDVIFKNFDQTFNFVNNVR